MTDVEIQCLEVHAYDWIVRDAYEDSGNLAIHCWSLNRDSEPCLLRFTTFPAFCFVELPQNVWGRPYKWSSGGISNFMAGLCQRLQDHSPIRNTFVNSMKLYYYQQGKTYPMLRLCFQAMEHMKHCANLLKKPIYIKDMGHLSCNVWESQIPVTRKLLTIQDVKYCQWFRVYGKLVDDDNRISTLKNEYLAEWDSMCAISLEECSGWMSRPGVLAFDIECYSDKHRAMPDKHNAKHVAYMISCVYQRYKKPETRRRYGIVIGDCNNIPEEKLAHCEIISVKSEYEMVKAFGDVIMKTDPEVITGYNIFGFDYPYLDHRIKRRMQEWPAMGRIIAEPSKMSSTSWNSGAYGHQSLDILQMEGRISVDLMIVVKREHKLDRYTLEFVCRKFLGKGKNDITAEQMFCIFEEMNETTLALEEWKRTGSGDGEQIHIRYTIAKEKYTEVVEYCVRDSELVIELFEKLHIWVWLIEMSSIVGVTPVELFTRGQQARCLSLLYNLAARSGYILDSRDTPGFGFGGGFVFDPIPDLYDNAICLDFSSLYPSIMQAYNICYTTLVPDSAKHSVRDSECHVFDFDQEETVKGIPLDADMGDDVDVDLPDSKPKRKKKVVETVIRHYNIRFYKGKEGLLPRLVRELVMERRAVNRNIFIVKDETKALEKIEDTRIYLHNYLIEELPIPDVAASEKKVKELSESQPPAPPAIITAAKRELASANLFNYDLTQKRLDELKSGTHKDLATFAQLENHIAGLYSEGKVDDLKNILAQLEASSVQRLVKIENNKMLITTMDKRQWGLKITANSFFGVLGIHEGGKIPLIEGAMAITAKGRELIGIVREYVEQTYGGTQIYGDTDSCTGETPILVKSGGIYGTIGFRQIKDLFPSEGYQQCACCQQIHNLQKDDLEIWTDVGWSKMRYIMRHKTQKDLFRVMTHTGCVEVTEDHSLLDADARKLTPKDVFIGKTLLHNDLPNYTSSSVSGLLAWLYGMFFARGVGDGNSCSLDMTGIKDERVWCNLDKMCHINPGSDRVTLHNMDFSKLFYSENVRQVPTIILTADYDTKKWFFQGWCDGSNTNYDLPFGVVETQIAAAGLYYVGAALGFHVYLDCIGEQTYSLAFSRVASPYKDTVKDITYLGNTPTYVYDIETENHHFAAGIGRMVVHNSIMFTLPQIQEAKDCNYWGVRISQEITGIKSGEEDCDGVLWPTGRPGLFPPPLGMEFEKAMRILCLCKKKYSSYLIGKDGNYKTEPILDSDGNEIGQRLVTLEKGIMLARREHPPTCRTIYKKIKDKVMDKHGFDEAMSLLIDYVLDLLGGKIPHRELVALRGLGANYKSANYFLKVFSDELKKAGKIVTPGDRLDYLVIVDPTTTILGQKMRLLEQYEESLKTDNPLVIDYRYYAEHSLMNPITQLISVGFKRVIAALPQIKFHAPRRRNPTTLEKPVLLILRLIENGFDVSRLKECIVQNVKALTDTPRLQVPKLRITGDRTIDTMMEEQKKKAKEKVEEEAKKPSKIIMPQLRGIVKKN